MKKIISRIFIFTFLFLCIIFIVNPAKSQYEGIEGGDVYWGDDSGGWVDEQSYAPEEQTQSEAAFQNYGAEGASDTGNYVQAMQDDWMSNGQAVETDTGYFAATQDGYVYREDADGRGFQQLGQNYQTGGLIDLSTGQTVDYDKNFSGYDSAGAGTGSGSGSGGYAAATDSGEEIELMSGGRSVELEDGTYGFEATDGKYYWYDQNDGTMNEVDMSGISGGVGTSGMTDASSGPTGVTNLIGNDQYGNPIYKEEGTGNIYELGSNGFVNASGSDIAINPLSSSMSVDEAAQLINGSFREDPTTGTAQFISGNSTYQVRQNSSGQMVYTNPGGQQMAVVQGGGGSAYGVPLSSLGAVSSSGLLGSAVGYASNLLGLSGGVGYSRATGVTGGLGFNSSTGSAASSLGGGLVSSLFGGSGTGTNTTGGFSYSKNGGWSGGLGFSSTSGSSYGTGGYYGGTGGVSSYMMGMGGGLGWNPGNYVSTGLPAGSIYAIIENVVLWILAIFGFICIIGFIISGVMYLLAAGDEKSQEKAKKALYYSITGVIVGLVGLVIIFAVNALLRGASYF